LRIIRQNRNLGNFANSNAVIRAAKGDLICKLDADDLLEPNFVSEMVVALLAHPEAVIVYCAMRLDVISLASTGYERKISGTEFRIGPEENTFAVISFNGQGLAFFLNGMPLSKSSGFNENSYTCREIGYFLENFQKFGGILYLDKVLATYRIHSLGREAHSLWGSSCFGLFR
jgi:glycosyltransferase involved in cell wall biosynthesis